MIYVCGIFLLYTIILLAVALKYKPHSIYEDNVKEKNRFEGKRVVFVSNEEEPCNADGYRGHLEEATSTIENPQKNTVYVRVVKRLIDIVIAYISILILSPLLVIIAALIWLGDRGPVFFSQKRVGINKRYFVIHKFRTMSVKAPINVPTHQLNNSGQLITKVGAFLRKTSLDELPQLWDILIGNMTIIGPRPALWNQDKLVALRDQYGGANDVKPGLTGLAQISGRDELELEEKARLDGEYASNISLKMDLKCFFETIKVVVGRAGYQEGKK